MKFIGLLMVSGENDILPETLNLNAQWCDAIYVLDGTGTHEPWSDDARESYETCMAEPKVRRWLHDSTVDPEPVRDGARQHLLKLAMTHHGPDNWFLLLHGDEVWERDPRDLPGLYPGADGFMFRLPLYFPRDGEPWDETRGPLEQLRWHLGPGWPEFRMFKGGPDVAFDPAQHFNVQPRGLRYIVQTDRVIRHYPYRAPDHQRARAQRHLETGFDHSNYAHISERDEVYWTDAMIAKARENPNYRSLVVTNTHLPLDYLARLSG